MEFCCLKPEGLIATVGLLERGSGVELRLLKDFSTFEFFRQLILLRY